MEICFLNLIKRQVPVSVASRSLERKQPNFDKSVLKCKFESQSLFVIVRKSADQASTRIYSVSVDF